jgi:hypothetical protein
MRLSGRRLFNQKWRCVMCGCEGQASNDGSDSLTQGAVSRAFDGSATAWLLSQAARHLNSADKEAERDYKRVIDVIRRCTGDLLETVQGIFRQTSGGDSSLRWNLLYVLGDAGNERSVDFLVATALNKLPDAMEGVGCESGRDMEILVSTMAIHALHRVAARHPNALDGILKVIEARPARPLLVEAVKAAVELGLRERAQHILPREDHWIFDVRRAHTQELFADPERQDGKERSFTPPKSGDLYKAPSVLRRAGKEK